MTDTNRDGKKLPALLGGFAAVLLLLFLDQWTKWMAVHFLKGKPSIPLISGVLELQYLENRGAAFGILQNHQFVFVVICGLFVLAVIFFYFHLPHTKRMLPIHVICILAVAGGIGNAIDRIRLNYVVDFIYFSLIDFPIFNVADCYVVICAVLLIIFYLFYYKDEDFSFLDQIFHRKEKTK